MFLDTRWRNILQNAKSIAIIGAKDKPNQAVDMVGKYLIAAGYTIYPVHPMRKNVWSLPTYKSMLDIPEDVDIINIFRASSYCVSHAQELVTRFERGQFSQCFWMQEGIFSNQAAQILAPYKVQIVENFCIKTAHHQVIGV